MPRRPPTNHTVAAEQRRRPACDARVRVRVPVQLHTGGACRQPLARLPKAVSGGGLRHPCCARTGRQLPPQTTTLPNIPITNLLLYRCSRPRSLCRPVSLPSARAVGTGCTPRWQSPVVAASHHEPDHPPPEPAPASITARLLPSLRHGRPHRLFPSRPLLTIAANNKLELVLSKSFFRVEYRAPVEGVDPTVDVETFATFPISRLVRSAMHPQFLVNSVQYNGGRLIPKVTTPPGQASEGHQRQDRGTGRRAAHVQTANRAAVRV